MGDHDRGNGLEDAVELEAEDDPLPAPTYEEDQTNAPTGPADTEDADAADASSVKKKPSAKLAPMKRPATQQSRPKRSLAMSLFALAVFAGFSDKQASLWNMLDLPRELALIIIGLKSKRLSTDRVQCVEFFAGAGRVAMAFENNACLALTFEKSPGVI